jgi:hypothetical protein
MRHLTKEILTTKVTKGSDIILNLNFVFFVRFVVMFLFLFGAA